MRVLSIALFLSLSACSPTPEPLGPDALAHGQSVIAPFKKELKATLQAGMGRGSVEAVQTCRIQAPRIAAESAAKHRTEAVEIGRSSHRLRNPKNAPRPWVEPLLEAYLGGDSSLEPQAVRLATDRIGYVEPIAVQDLCLNCHGESLAPAVAAEISRLYPDDQATGFKTGDFRGVFWAEITIP